MLNLANGPDLLLGKCGRTHLAECKTGTRKLRVGQDRWHQHWRGAAVAVLRNVDDVLAFDRCCQPTHQPANCSGD